MAKPSWLKNLLRPTIALLFIYFLIQKGPFRLDQITFILGQSKILLLGLALVLFQFSITALRWKKIVELKKRITFFHFLFQVESVAMWLRHSSSPKPTKSVDLKVSLQF